MRVFRTIAAGLNSLLRRKKTEQELDEELSAFLEMAAEEKIKRGMNREAARSAVRLERDTLDAAKELVWSARWESFVETCWQDLRFAVRTLRKSAVFTTVVCMTLAVGIGANSAIFSVIQAVSLRPLPYKNPGRLVLLNDSQDEVNGAFLFRDIESFKAENRSFEAIAAYYRDSGFSSVTLTSGGEPEFVQGAFVSANFFPLMGIEPALGRVFSPSEETQRARVVVLSHRLWTKSFGSSDDAVGKTIRIDGLPSQIIGVMPTTFEFPARDQEFWAPVTTNRYWDDSALTKNIDPAHNRYFYERWQAIGRLKTSVTIREAQAETNALFRRSELPLDGNNVPGITLTPLHVTLSKNSRLALTVLFAAVTLVLLIACSNVASLVMARCAAREREIILRTALGAGRGRLTRQLLTECAVLGAVGAGLGLLLAYAGLHFLIALGPPEIPRLEQAKLAWGTLMFALAISLFATCIFGLLPAWKTSLSDPALIFRTRSQSTGTAPTRARSVLVIAEFAVAVVILAAAGLLIRSFTLLNRVDLGFEPTSVLTMNIVVPETPESKNAFHKAVLERVRTLPGVYAAGEINKLFELEGIDKLGLRVVEGRAPEPRDRWTPLSWASIRGDYFQAMGSPILEGRYFSDQDGPYSPLVAIIDEAMARRYWPGENPLEKHFKGQDPRGHDDDWLTVVGVVRDMRRSGLETTPSPHVYQPSAQALDGAPAEDLVIRTTGNPKAVAESLRPTVRELSSTAILSNVSTIEDQLSDQLRPRRFQTLLLALFSGVAVVLSAVGIFGLMHYSVTQRTHEIGIRGALGAEPGDTLRLVLGEATRLGACGISIGICASLMLTRYMASLLFGVAPTDFVTFFTVAGLLFSVSLLASYLPARRASRVDPMVALRY